jgi:hypothetical protein
MEWYCYIYYFTKKDATCIDNLKQRRTTMNYAVLNQTLVTFQKAKKQYYQLCQMIDQEIIQLDKNNLLQPGEISIRDWTMTFEFNHELKKALWEKFLPDPEPVYQNLNHMTRDELENFILDKDIELDADDYKDDPLEALIDAIKHEINVCGAIDHINDYEIGDLECRFEHIGFNVMKPKKSQNAEINIYLEMESDDTNWPLIKKTASYLNGEIQLHEDNWEFNEIKIKTFDLSNVIDHTVIAGEIVKLADKLWELSK